METDTSRSFLQLHQLAWLSFAISLVILPHVSRIPVWVSILFVCLLLWRLSSEYFSWSERYHGFLFRCAISLLAIGALIGIYISFGRVVGRDPGVALLVVLAAFKLLEARQPKDAYVITCLGYILIITNFFYDESIPIALFMTLATVILTCCFIVMNDHQRLLGARDMLKLSSSMLLLSIPVMIILFLFFPRVSGPLWRMPEDAHAAKTGISDRMSPGSISQLSASNALAFRVEFKGSPPAAEQMYWRGPVLWHTDGRTWTRDLSSVKPTAARDSINLKRGIKYNVTLEPTNKDWIYGLDTIVRTSIGFINHDSQVISKKNLSRVRYLGVSDLEYASFEKNTDRLQKALQLPKGFHPRARQLAAQWRNSRMNLAEIVNTAMTMFREQDFYYTLQPPLLNNDPVDEFLFDSRQGFCEHYASSFVVLMRAAGIPARVVTGYQGASYNALGDYYNVYQRDAHAWAEVYMPSRGWVRVDPTSAVAPERVLQGMEEVLPELTNTAVLFDEDSLPVSLLKNIRDSWDHLNYRWNLWVLGYGEFRQMQIMQKLGLEKYGWQGAISVLFFGMIGMLALIAAWLFYSRYTPSDPVLETYRKFCKKLRPYDLTRMPNEGPEHFYQRVGQQLEALEPTVREITDMYIQLRYGKTYSTLTEFKQAVKQFHPQRIIKSYQLIESQQQ